MSILQVSNVHLESSGNNRVQYTGSNTVTFYVAGNNVLTLGGTTAADSAYGHIFDFGTNLGVLELKTSSSDGNGTSIHFFKNDADPIDWDSVASILAYGKNSIGETYLYSAITFGSRDITDGSEQGYWQVNVSEISDSHTLYFDGDELWYQKVDEGTTGPEFNMVHNSLTPANNDVIGKWTAQAFNSANTKITYSSIRHILRDNQSGSEDGQIDFRVRSDSVDTLKVTIDGDGIKFNGDTAAANALDDYEEGTWTPAITSSGGGESVAYTTQDGRYTKIGDVVYYEFNVVINTISGGSGNARVSLPITVGNGTPAMAYMSGPDWTGAIPFGFPSNGNAYWEQFGTTDNATGSAAMAITALANGDRINCAGFYWV